MRRFLLAFAALAWAAACATRADSPPPDPATDGDIPLPRHAILPTIPAAIQPTPAQNVTPPTAGGGAQPGGKAPQVAAFWAKEKYADLLAAGGRITFLTSPVLARTLKGDEVYQLAVGSRYPIATVGPLARRMLIVDLKKKEVVLDFDAAQLDSEAAQKLGGFLAPATSPPAMADAAGVVAVLAPLDPYFPNPGEPEFKLKKDADKRSLATWLGGLWRYDVWFGADGRVVDLKRFDRRPKPICFEHRARAQALIDRLGPVGRLAVGDVIWDQETARLAPHHYLYEVRAADGTRAGLASVEKGPGAARFVDGSDRAAVLALARQVLAPARDAQTVADAAAVVLGLLAHAGSAEVAPLGAPLIEVTPDPARGGSSARARDLDVVLHFDATGRVAP